MEHTDRAWHGIIPLYRINAETYFAVFCKVSVNGQSPFEKHLKPEAMYVKKVLEAFIPYILRQVGLYNEVEHATGLYSWGFGFV